MREKWRHRSIVVMVGMVSIAAEPQARAEEPEEWCGTYDYWVAAVGNQKAVASGECPTEGTCDVPSVRDSWIPGPSTPIVTLRIKFHVFCEDDGTDCAASASDVAAQLTKLNSDFAPYRIQFTEGASAEFHGSSTYRHLNSSEVFPIKINYADDPAHQLNVFVTDVPDYFNGFGTFPWDPFALTEVGGIVIDETVFGAGGEVLTHETGHCLGLWHTFHGVHPSEVDQCSACYERADGVNADTTGDLASDTPPTPLNRLCADPSGDDPCSDPPTPWAPTQPENYMGYGGDACWTQFTPQQAGRMHCWIRDVLTGWIACTTDADCDDGISCTQDTCVAGACAYNWPACDLNVSDGCCGVSCEPATDADCFCGDGTCDQSEDRCTCASDCGAPPINEAGGVTCQDGIDNDCDGYVDCDDALGCASDAACYCVYNGTNLVCVDWDGAVAPEPGQDFDITVTDPDNPDVTFITGNDGWKVWSQTSYTDDTPANLGRIQINPALSTANFNVAIAHGPTAGAANVASIELVKSGWTGESNLSWGNIAGDLTGDLVVQESAGQGGVTSFTIGGNVNGTVTIPKVDRLQVKGAVSSGATITLLDFVGEKRADFNTQGGSFSGNLFIPNGIPSGAIVSIGGQLTDSASLDLNGQPLAGQFSLNGGSAPQSVINIGSLTGMLRPFGAVYSGTTTIASSEHTGSILMTGATLDGHINVLGDWAGGMQSVSGSLFTTQGSITVGGDVTSTGSFDFEESIDGALTMEGCYMGSLCGSNLSPWVLNSSVLPPNIDVNFGPGSTICGTDVGSGVSAALAELEPIVKNRFLTVRNPVASRTAIGVSIVGLDGFAGNEDRILWAGPPQTFTDPNGPNFKASPLQCTPSVQTSSTWGSGDIHLYGPEILPDSTYQIWTVVEGNDTALKHCGLVSSTAMWGDVTGPSTDPPDGVANFLDITAMVATFKEQGSSALPKTRAILVSNAPDPSRHVSFAEITATVDAFKGAAYASQSGITGPCPCPSQASCDTECTSNSFCVGGTGMCVGLNPGTCRDACGRCE